MLFHSSGYRGSKCRAKAVDKALVKCTPRVRWSLRVWVKAACPAAVEILEDGCRPQRAEQRARRDRRRTRWSGYAPETNETAGEECEDKHARAEEEASQKRRGDHEVKTSRA